MSNEGSSKLISNGDTINANGGYEILGVHNITSNTENEITSLTTNIIKLSLVL